MARFPRVVAVGFPHHITQRGNRRQDVFDNDSQRLLYLDLLAEHARLYSLRVLGFCLMTNHLHLVAVPEHEQAMAKTMKYVHGRFAQFWNALARTTGHVWQNRFYSCPMEWPAVDRVIRYAELNPVRAGLVRDARAYRWSSARAHQGEPDEFHLLDGEWWQQRWTARAWFEFLGQPADADCPSIRGATHTGRPLGSAAYVADLECRLGRTLQPRPGGRPPKAKVLAAT
jgi:putative transposase